MTKPRTARVQTNLAGPDHLVARKTMWHRAPDCFYETIAHHRQYGTLALSMPGPLGVFLRAMGRQHERCNEALMQFRDRRMKQTATVLPQKKRHILIERNSHNAPSPS